MLQSLPAVDVASTCDEKQSEVASHLVQVPVSDTPLALLDQVRLPDFTAISNGKVWTVALTSDP